MAANRMDYIIVQAGGRGSRMETLTRNKPKALVPVENLPMIFHLFRRFPEKKYIIIGDYQFDVLKRYLRAFADVEYRLISATGHTGTCAGLSDALALVPEGERFMLIWCDLILPKDYEIPETDANVIGIARDFPCRWKYEDGVFSEERSDRHGVAGHFIFREKRVLAGVPERGEFVRWLATGGIAFEIQPLYNTREYGLYSAWRKLPVMRCRPFNRITIQGSTVIKEGIDAQGRKLAEREVSWYKKLRKYNFKNMPEIVSYDPICMEYIDGKNIYEYTDLPFEQKSAVLERVIRCLKEIHRMESAPFNAESYYEAYLGKTYERLKKVRDLVPFANDRWVTINGKACRNIFYFQDEVERLVMYYAPKEFVLLHGDCTFSNIMLLHDTDPVLIDPRGYFGKTEYCGDAAYDWVKLYYSLASNYDQFNLKRFSLEIGKDSVSLDIASNQWEDMEDVFFELLDGEVTRRQMKLMLAIIWLSLTTYAWEDYDSICGAFYNGLYYFEEAMEMESAYDYFDRTIAQLSSALRGVLADEMEALISDCADTLRRGNKIIASGLGKNVPICEKFEGTILSLGLNAQFLHTNSAVHGDVGMVKPGDLVILLTKSGSTAESIYLEELLEKREGVQLWLMSCQAQGVLARKMKKKLIIPLQDEGDPWNLMPNNSSTVFLIVLQTLAMQMIEKMGLHLNDFGMNHPGGAIGEKLRNE